MIVKVKELRGPDTYWALQAYIKLLFGLKMLPAYLGLTLEEFFDMIEKLPVEDRRKIVREAVIMVTLEPDELNALAKFATDANNVPFTRENMKSLAPGNIFEILHAVTQEIAALEPNFLSVSEKKN